MADPRFSRPPPCPECGGHLAGGYVPADPHRVKSWRYRCVGCSHGWVSTTGPLTLATAPWTAPVVAAVLEVVDRHIDGAPEWDASPGTLALRSLREDLA